MGGGGLRILGHKRWHVWKRENIERVLRDERIHEEQTADERLKRKAQDQEVRLEQLRNSKRSKKAQPVIASASSGSEPKQATTDHKNKTFENINFFTNLELKQRNREDEEEKRVSKLKEQRKLGVAPLALGGRLNRGFHNRNELQDKEPVQPWYTYEKTKNPLVNRYGKRLAPQEIHKREQAVQFDQQELDPMKCFVDSCKSKHLERIEKTKKEQEVVDFTGDDIVTTRRKISTSEKSRKKKKKKSKKSRKKTDSSSSNNSIEELRAARLAREKLDRERSKDLLQKFRR